MTSRSARASSSCWSVPRAAGKTTTLRIVAGLEKPTEGEGWVCGRRVDRVPPRDRDVAVVS